MREKSDVKRICILEMILDISFMFRYICPTPAIGEGIIFSGACDDRKNPEKIRIRPKSTENPCPTFTQLPLDRILSLKK
jgi:hypothetical protein